MSDTVGEQIRWSYRPGAWFGVVGEHVGVLVPASAKDRVAALWEAADDAADFDTVLDALVSGGLSGLPAFALIGLGAETRLLVRGAAVSATVATSAGEEQVHGSAVGTWVDRTFDTVESLQISVEDQDVTDVDDLPLPGGLVRVGRLNHPAVASEGPVLADERPAAEGSALGAVAAVGPVAVPDEAADDWLSPSVSVAETEMPGLDEMPDTEPVFEPEPEPEPAVEPEEELGAPDEIDAGAETEMFPVVGGSPDSMPAAPSIPPPPPLASVPPLPEPPTSHFVGGDDESGDPLGNQDDHDGMTQAGFPGEEYPRSAPGIPGQPEAPSVTRTVARLLVSNGDSVDVDRVILVGRAPEARRFTSADQPKLLTVPSRLQEISSTHLEVRPGTGVDHGTAVVTDMGSTNGTVLVQPGLEPEDLKPGIAVQLLPGAVINLGDGVTIQVTRPE